MRKPAAIVSAAIHILVVLLLLIVTVHAPVMKPPREHVHLLAPLRPFLPKSGGGGQNNPLPPSRGRAPTVISPRLFVPPTIIHNENPKLAIALALLEPPEMNIDSDQFGDPLGKAGIPSGGPGHFGGIGIGDHSGVGPASGSRLGTVTSTPPPKITRNAQVIYKEEPEYSDEARKAHWEGTVILAVDVDTAGRTTNIRVVRSLGLGLDEKAIAAVARWKFRPALSGDRPVTTPATIEVTFRLL